MRQKFTYSEGEKYVQKSAGVEFEAERLTGMVKDFIPENGKTFIQNQPLFFISSVDEHGALWTSVITTKSRDFARFVSDDLLEIYLPDTKFHSTDILFQNVKSNPNVGLLFIEFAHRRRFRINGLADLKKETIGIDVQQAFPNCPKYIQARDFNDTSEQRETSLPAQPDSKRIRALVESADTFIMGTQGADGGVDCSHRGGMKGFLSFVDEDTIKIPDYSGNNMFTSLGNIRENPNTGLLFIDFQTGATLQLSGQATLSLEEQDLYNGVERYWYFKIERSLLTENALSTDWSEPRFSPFNPPVEE